MRTNVTLTMNMCEDFRLLEGLKQAMRTYWKQSLFMHSLKDFDLDEVYWGENIDFLADMYLQAYAQIMKI